MEALYCDEKYSYLFRNVMLDFKEFCKEDTDFVTGITFNGFYKNMNIKGEDADLVVVSFYVKTSHNRLINLCCILNAIKPNTVIDIFPDMIFKNSPSSLTDHIYSVNGDIMESERADAYAYCLDAIQLFAAPDKIKKIKLYIRKEHFQLIGYILDTTRLGLKISDRFVNRLETFESPLYVEKADISDRKVVSYSIIKSQCNLYDYDSAIYIIYALSDYLFVMEHRHFNCTSRKQRKKIVQYMKDKYNVKESSYNSLNTLFVYSSGNMLDSETKYSHWYITKEGQLEVATYYPTAILNDDATTVKYKYLELNYQDIMDIDNDFKEIIDSGVNSNVKEQSC